MLKKPFFSIVIPTLNEEKYLPLLLKDLSEQTFTDFEVIHVDGSSEDKTVEKAREWRKRFYLKTEKTKTRNVSFQRNLGGKKARGKWVVFMDADNRLPKYFLQGIRYRVDEKPKTDVFTTWIKIEKKTAKYQTIETGVNLNIEFGKIVGKEIAVGAMIGVKREVFEKNKFDEKVKIIEDALFVKELVKSGHNFSIFKDPTYFYSMRRLEAEGTLKMTVVVSQLIIRHLQGKKFSQKDYGYVMKGGKYYEKIAASPFRDFASTIEKASEKQLKKIKEIVNNIQEF